MIVLMVSTEPFLYSQPSAPVQTIFQPQRGRGARETDILKLPPTKN